MRKYGFAVVSFLALFTLASHFNVQEVSGDESQLQAALKGMKREIRTKIEVSNPGKITGTVQCRRVRHSGDAIVYIEKVGDNNYPAPTEHGIMDQMNLIFVPSVLAVQKGTTVDFPNSDAVRHNVFSPPDCCNQFNLGTYDAGASKPFTFDKVCEVPLLCNVHAEMAAYIMVFENPCFAITARDGSFTIDNIPPGSYTLKTWHGKLKSVSQDVTVEGGKTIDVKFMLKKRK